MQIAVKVETGFNCNWRNIEPLQPEGFKGQTANEKETLKNSIVKNGFHDAFDVWQHDNKLLSIDGVHRKIALLELAAEGYEIPEQLPCTYITAANETEAATIILSRNAQHSHILSAAVMTAAFKIPAAIIEAVVPQKNLDRWNGIDNDIPKHEDNTVYGDNEDLDTYQDADNETEKYTTNITAPIYEPKNEKPNIEDLFNSDKCGDFVESIKKSSVTETEKDFLIKAAQRHTVFNYEKIADYYAHSSKEMQELMEQSALVIIDFKKAIELGYVRVCEEIKQQYLSEYGE